MSKIKDELLDYLERHDLEEVPEGVSLDDIVQDNMKAKGIKNAS